MARNNAGGRFSRLIAQLHEDLKGIRLITEEISTALDELGGKQPSRLETSGLAHQLELFYTAIEDLFGRISLAFEGELPRGDQWHKELLGSMSLELPELRPAVIEKDLLDILDQYRRFRHRARHVYRPPVPDWGKMSHLVTGAGEVYRQLQKQVEDFISFLQRLARET